MATSFDTAPQRETGRVVRPEPAVFAPSLTSPQPAPRLARSTAGGDAGVPAAAGQRNRRPGRPAQLLAGAVLIGSPWLLDGARGTIDSGRATLLFLVLPVAFSYLTLGQPDGRLQSPEERRFLWSGVGVLSLLVIADAQAGDSWARYATAVAAVAVTGGTLAFLYRRGQPSAPGVRLRFLPVRLAGTVTTAALVAYVASGLAGWPGASDARVAYISGMWVIPPAILLGWVLERLYMGQTLAHVIGRLASHPDLDPDRTIAEAIGDPTPQAANRTAPEADPFIRALRAAALLQRDRARLAGDLTASRRSLSASRTRILEAADAERRRLERDLHDGVQQQLLGLRLKLDVAAETIKHEPATGERMLAAVGDQIDEVLTTLRSLARGIYPAVLSERGLPDAIKSAARTSPVPVTVRCKGVGRYRQEIEVAVYFCCLEALQNVAKHAGRGAHATVTLSAPDGALVFGVCDVGTGFDVGTAPRGSGLGNMTDRMEAIGGTLTVTSAAGEGTAVVGRVTVA